MGCAYSTNGRAIFRKINDNSSLLHPRKMFKVINVDESGNEISLGQIEITQTELILHQKGRNPIVWSLRSIRRYGFDSQLFSFECGRRCPTGPGVYGFKCPQAEQLFNILQESVQRCSSTANDNLPTPHDLADSMHQPPTGIVPISFNASALANTFASVQRQQENPRFANDDDFRPEPSSPTTSGVSSFPNTIAPEPPSTGSANSPVRLGGLSVATFKYANNSMRDYVNSPSYMNTSGMGTEFAFRTSEGSANTSPEKSPVRTNFAIRPDEMQPYVNVQISSQGPPLSKVGDKSAEEQEFTVNYTTLDLDNPLYPTADASNNNAIVVITAPVTPVSKTFKHDFSGISPPRTPNYTDESISARSIPYVAIDFDKTVALSNSAATHRKEILHHS